MINCRYDALIRSAIFQSKHNFASTLFPARFASFSALGDSPRRSIEFQVGRHCARGATLTRNGSVSLIYEYLHRNERKIELPIDGFN